MQFATQEAVVTIKGIDAWFKHAREGPS